MARVRSVEFLPEIFQTDTNKQFLAATLDQLIQEPKFKKTQGFIGRRVGPGVNPNDYYVVEPTKTRANYQLEAGIVSLKPDTDTIQDAITYPGLLDAIEYQGGNSTRPDRLFESQYYTWDPFINWDTFINFSQYFWLPAGPDAVDVAATGVPASDEFTVNRANGVYTFSGLQGNNPTIDLVRGGSYDFLVAQNAKETVNYRVTNAGTSSYVIDYQNNPTLTLTRGDTYVFTLSLTGAFPFYIKTVASTGLADIYSNGVTNNGAVSGQITFVVPQDAPDTLFYSCATQSNLRGQINIIDGTPGTGPGFWIQTAPGISGKIPATPNISSRDVYGVTNNGEDLGTVTFNVPTKTAQQFYYDLNSIGTVDLVTGLQFDQINNVAVDTFLNTYGGIDGITSLNGRTLVFTTTNVDAAIGGWYRTTFYDPLAQDSANNGLPGSYDSLGYALQTEVPLDERYSIWQINYYTNNGVQYISLTSATSVAELDKFMIRYGDTYASTNWFKNDAGVFRQIPLLTAALDTLYYQDATDPEIFGRIRLIDAGQSSTLFVEEILGKTSYTSPNGVTFTNGLKVTLRGDVEPASYANNTYYVAGVGTAIELLPEVNFITPESYVVDYNDSTEATEPSDLDYLTIDRASKDLNAWTRSNRWFHIDVINATAEYNNTTVVIDNAFRAKRPIIEFRPGVRLFNMGTEGKAPVDVIDFEETDAFSNIEGTTAYSVDGYNFVDGSRVIFAADADANVRNKIWEVTFVTPDSVTPQIEQPIINLTLATDGEVLVDQSTVCINGDTLKGLSFWYDGVEWIEAQLKTKVQQAPLFNVYDSAGVSLSNLAKYPSTTFAGSKLFSYAVGDTGVLDPILQFPLQYLNLNNVGDIVFENNLYKDTFLYVRDNVSITELISSGFAREYASRAVYQRLIGWETATTQTQIRQQFTFTYDGNPLQLDVKAVSNGKIPAVKIYVGGKFQDPGSYTIATTNNTTTLTLDSTYVIGDTIEVAALSDQISQVGFYQVPINLEKNPLNGNSDQFTLGTIRTHYESICENLTTLSGPINGANNTRDLGDIGTYGLIILQQSSPLTLAGYFNRSKDYNIFASLQYNSREYQKFKNIMLEEVTRLTLQFETPGEILTEAMANITLGRVETSPFYWSDMVPTGSVYTQTVYTVSLITTNVFDTVQVYDYTSANFLGMLVYKNNVLLTRGIDYTVSTDGPTITILTELAIGDVITLQEFSATYGNFVPNTPTKLGLYPAYRPEIREVTTTTGSTLAIIGHDGSITPAFDDVRDQVLLEFETRIYNNLKLDGNPVPLTMTDVLPGQFRVTGYSFEEINSILSVDFLSYVGWNKLDYTSQNYIPSNEFSWNYSGSQDKLTKQNLLGAWRGINRYFYDTEDPSATPWEMLGLTVKPTWWNTVYGPGPYTSDNLVLWDDLELGQVADPAGAYIVPEYARPGLSNVIPVDSEGNLLSPFESVVEDYNASSFQRSWVAGDGGPVEASWWNSSAYPFAVMRVLALTRPAKFYSLFADRDLYRYQDEFGQYLYSDRYRLDANGIQVYGDGTSKASFIDWIVDYNRQSGINSTADLTADLASIDVRLCYRMASFSDKQYIKLYTEKSSPNSLNSTLLIPDESYDLLLYKNQPFDRVSYSGVVIQTVADGWAVYGYSTSQPYFDILVSQGIGNLKTYTVGSISIRVPTSYTNTIAQVPYGFVFSNQTAVADFLLSYGKLLETQGLTFTDRANGYQLDWSQMAREFLYWSQQGWGLNSLINLNPLAGALTITKPGAVVDSIVTQTSDNVLLDQNKRELPVRNLNVVRLANTIMLEPLTDQSLSFADLRFTNFEHMIVLNNKSVFGDLIYEPITGARQSRLNLVAITSTEWNGTVDAQGFILNQDNVEEWTGLKKYTKGQIVKYKDQYWSAATIVDPSPTFDFNKWLKSDYSQIQNGLLPNIANKANQLQNTYSINTANLESDNDLLSYGLIGFRPRQYMAALNLDDVSQVNVYSQFLGSKGTILSAELLSQANLGKESADYQIYENWAVQRAVYGANANRSFFELRLNRALLNSNPSLVQVTLPEQVSQADQTILLSNVWKQSYKLTSPDILPTTTVAVTDTALPSAGYVNLDDADITVFNLSDPTSLEASIDSVEVGATVWVAKVNNYDWNIYRCVQVPGYIDHACDNLDGTSIVYFTKEHGLTAGDQVIIRFLDPNIDGVYRILTTPTVNSVTIAYTFTGKDTAINGVGIGFTLQTQRVAQASDILNLPYANDIQTGAKVWVDDNGDGQWEVLEKQNPFSDVVELAPALLSANEQYGQSVTQAKNRLAALVGSPLYSSGQGAVYVYVKNYSDQYAPVSPLADGDAILTLEVDGAKGYGNAVDFGAQTWAVAGASKSQDSTGLVDDVGYATVIYRDPRLGEPGVNPYTQTQLLVSPDASTAGEFGYSVAMSDDERWMYIGAPGVNKVHAYGRVDWQNQYVRVSADGTTQSYSIGNTIQVDNQYQLKVTLNGQLQTITTDYTVSGLNTVTFTSTPGVVNATAIVATNTYTILTAGTTDFTLIGAPNNNVGTVFVATAAGTGTGTVLFETVVEISRYNFVQVPYNAATYDLSDDTDDSGHRVGLFTAQNIYSFSIKVTSPGDFTDKLLRPGIDYTFAGTTINFGSTTFGSDDIIIVTSEGYFELADTLTVSGLAADARFGHSVSCTTDGRQVIVGCRNETVDTSTEAGTVYVFDRNVQRFIYGDDPSSTVFPVLGDVDAPVSVIVNNQFLINETDSVVGADGTFIVEYNSSTSEWEVTIQDPLSVGDVIEIETNQFTQVQRIAQHPATVNAGRFIVNQTYTIASVGTTNFISVGAANNNVGTVFVATGAGTGTGTATTNAGYANFGQSLDLCSYNCSLYVGAPQDSTQAFKSGAVERDVNQSRVYGTITATVANPTLTAGNTLRVNNTDVVVPGAGTVASLATAINAAVPNVTASVSTTGYLTIAVTNSAAAPAGNKLQVAPGSVGTAFTTLGFETFVYTQSIYSPYPVDYAAFGYSVNIDTSAQNLVVGAPKGTLYLFTVFDDGTTDWDGNSTIFFSTIIQSGAVYTYDYLPSASDSALTPGKFVFGLQISDSHVYQYDNYGTSVNYTDGVLMIGGPGNDAEFDGSTIQYNYGRVYVFENPDRIPAWTVIHQQQPVVDIRLLNSVFTYDRITSARTEQFDFFDPLQGKILGAARQNIDYIGAIDPASYNVGPINNNNTTWLAEHVGQIWWDISTVRFIDPNQDDIVYASRRWSQLFPGSSVDVYQWIQSDVPPANYTGVGTPLNTVSYTVSSRLSIDGTFNTYYYFWVRGIDSVSTQQGKTLSADTVSRYIESPKSSGIPYIAPINASTIAIYNANDIIQAEDTIINIEFDREYTTDNVHVEYELIAQDKSDGFLSNNLYRKLQDSFCGVDTAGNLVPDPNLNAAERYGVQFRPRQSMFVDRFEALKNYIKRANAVFTLYPIVENRSFVLLNSSDPEPESTTGSTVNWNLRVANLEILSYQNIDAVPLGYKYLVASDSLNNGLWTIYEVQLAQGSLLGARELVLIKVQNYDTKKYWSYINWYRPGYNSSTKVIAEVPTYSSLATLDVAVGSSVRVTANAQGKFEIYLLEALNTWTRVGLQDGTIAISAEIYDYALGRFGFDVEVFDAQYFDQEPVIETRKIIQAINEEIFIDELALERNKLLTLMFNFVLSEFSAPEWLVKTSLIDVDHRIRNLEPFQNYRQDNQEFVLDYIQEVKPYHVQIREFNLLYNGQDQYFGSMTDFDVPAYYNTSLPTPQYTSPILTPYAHSTYQSDNTNSDASSDALVWQEWPYSQWYGNYLLSLESITVVNGGSGFTDAPTVTIVGDAVTPATAVAFLNSQGQVAFVTVTDVGSGYRSAPTIVFEGGNGVNAQAYPVLIGKGYGQTINGSGTPTELYYNLARSFRTVIRYDRFDFVSQVTNWQANVHYEDGTLVRYDDRVWRATSLDSTAVESPTFDLENWTLVPAGDLSAADRVTGYYTPGVNEPGNELPLLIDGIDYPGVQVYGTSFDSVEAIDAEYASSFTDVYLGTRPTDINVSGGEFIGPYEGHAPEELVNGSEFDTVDIRVYTRPGSDWSLFDGISGQNGHGFQIASRRYTVDVELTDLDWSGLEEHPAQLIVSNITTGLDLVPDIDYVVNWVAQTIEIISTVNVAVGNILNVSAYEVGGGSQLFRQNYIGSDVGNTLIIPVSANEINSLPLFVNGEFVSVTEWEAYYPANEWDQLIAYERLDVVYTTGTSTTYYRALQQVPAGIAITNTEYWFEYVPATLSKVTLPSTYGASDFLVLTVLGTTTPVQYSWSTPQTQYFTVTRQINSSKTVQLSNSLSGTNVPNIIVDVDGLRLRPYEGIEYIGDGTTDSFNLPSRGGYEQSIVDAYSDVSVYVNDELQVQGIGATVGDYSVSNWDGSSVLQVIFVTPPPEGARIIISVSTVAEYLVSGNQLQLVNAPPFGGTIAVTTWNDTAQQNIVTLVFQGPISTGSTIVESFDSTPFDEGSVTGAAGSYDYSVGTSIPNNDFNLNRADVNPSRLWVTLDGYRLFDGEDFVIQGEYLILASGAIAPNQVMVITEFAETIVPEALAFRVFQDMRGVQATFRITEATTTALAVALAADADIAYVTNANALTEPDLPNGVFGVCTINAERIMYRVRDTATNSISGLLRGTGGTAAASHSVDAPVYDMGRGNLMYKEYQDYIDSQTWGALCTDSNADVCDPNRTAGQTVFTADIGPVDAGDSAGIDARAIEVYVGGIKQMQYLEVAATDLEVGLTYNIESLGTTNWNSVAGTTSITYAVNDRVTVVTAGTGTGTAVYRGTEYLWTCTDVNDVTIEFTVDDQVVPPLEAPANDSEVTILVRRGQSWYQPGESTASDGIALQETNTLAARFLRGL